jgi:RimJ/RimL family protein N-acetyltransferase
MLSDGRVYLRKLEGTDLDRTWEWMQRPDVFLKIGVHVPISKSQQHVWFESVDRAADKVVFAVCLHDGDAHVGNVSLDTIDPRHRNARLSIFIADQTDRGKGLGGSAMRLLARYAFDFLNLEKIWCKTDSDDEKVTRFYEKLGFVREGLLRRHEFIDGQYRDKALLALFREA